MATLKGLGYTSLIIADPTICLHERLQLAWYTGWMGLDLPSLLGGLVRHVASTLGSDRIVHVGASGGGFAALQVAPYTRGSTVLTMNPQTAIHRYRVEDKYMGVQRTFVQHVVPELWPHSPESLEWGSDWWLPMADRLSAVSRYRNPQHVRVHFVQNMNDTHHVMEHFEPFLDAVAPWMESDHLKVTRYDGPAAHVAPDNDRYLRSFNDTLNW